MSLLETWSGATNDKSPTLNVFAGPRGKERFHRSSIPGDRNSRLAPGVALGSTIMISALLIQELSRRGSGVLTRLASRRFPQAVIAGRVCKCCLIRELDRALYSWFYICVSGNKTQRTKEKQE
jgi:hypothetical protein